MSREIYISYLFENLGVIVTDNESFKIAKNAWYFDYKNKYSIKKTNLCNK